VNEEINDHELAYRKAEEAGMNWIVVVVVM
jgi:hypothetical protein